MEGGDFSLENKLQTKAVIFEIPVIRVLVITVVIPAPVTFIASAAALWSPMAIDMTRR